MRLIICLTQADQKREAVANKFIRWVLTTYKSVSWWIWQNLSSIPRDKLPITTLFLATLLIPMLQSLIRRLLWIPGIPIRCF